MFTVALISDDLSPSVTFTSSYGVTDVSPLGRNTLQQALFPFAFISAD